MNQVLFSIGFVAFNNADDVQSMVDYLEDWNCENVSEYLLVDHSSHSVSREAIQEITKKAGWGYCPRPNLGFGAGVNAICSMCTGNRVLVMANLDVKIKGPPPFFIMAEAVLNQGYTLVGTSLLDANRNPSSGRLPAWGWSVVSWDYKRDHSLIRDLSGELHSEAVIPWSGSVHGGCFALDVSVWDKFGGLDENLFLYGEEFDLSMKVKRAGGRIGFLDGQSISHRSEGNATLLHKVANMYNMKYLASRESMSGLTYYFMMRWFFLVVFHFPTIPLFWRGVFCHNLNRKSLFKVARAKIQGR